MDHLLLDTDIILDLFFDRKPHAEFSAKLISLCESKKVKGFVTPVIIANLYYLLRKTASHGDVIKKLLRFLDLVEILEMDRSIVIDSLKSDFNDFEDALQYHSAVNNKAINFIITRNLKDYKYSKIAVTTPENYFKTFVY